MKIFQRIILAVSIITFFFILWKMDPAAVFRHISGVGWGILLILGQEILAHVFNAWGWQLAFPKEETKAYPLSELIKLRIVGDGVNYLTPSGTVAGEFVRAMLLNHSRGYKTRYTSVTVAKLSQALAQLVFILIGILVVLQGIVPALLKFRSQLFFVAGGIFSVLACFSVFSCWLWSRLRKGNREISGNSWLSFLGAMPYEALSYIRLYPYRFALSMAWFAVGYAWGGFEGYWICRFLGIPATVSIALTIEVFSNLVDSILFMVPAKIGTQELGKTAIFTAMGLNPTAGFAFGLVRHIREIIWGAAGLVLYSAYKVEQSGQSPSQPDSAPISNELV